MDIGDKKQALKEELSGILERSRYVENQKQARDDAVDRLTRAEALAVAATLDEMLNWIPSLRVETNRQAAATAVSVTASVTGEDSVSASGLVTIAGDLLTTEFEALEAADYVLLDDFTGDARPIDSRERLVEGLFDAFTQSYRRRYEFVLTDPSLRDKVLLTETAFDG
ncbi:MAG: hypothetical protein ACON4V_04905 [Parvibaculales bacterium]